MRKLHDRSPSLAELAVGPLNVSAHDDAILDGASVAILADVKVPTGDRWPAPVQKVAAWVNVTREVLDEAAYWSDFMEKRMLYLLDRRARPWAYSDPPALPYFQVWRGRFGALLDRMPSWIVR